MFRRFLTLIPVLLFPAMAAATPVAPVINEFVANHTGTDTNEFVEVYGIPGANLGNLTLLEIEGDGSGAGVIDGVWTLGTTDANGFWTTGFLNNMIENGTMTLLLVSDFSGSQGDDIDADNDGTPDSTPWSAVMDGIAVSDGGGSDYTYTAVTLTAFYDGLAFEPGGASRIPNGTDTDSAADWIRNDFDGEGLPGFSGSPAAGEALNTPGDINEAITPPGDPVLNEFVANHTGADDYEYIEILGDPDAGYDGYRILVVEGDGANPGRVDAIRTPGTTNGDGYWVTPFMSGVLENGSQTLLLVEGSTAFIGLDLDTDDDGVMDTMPWTRLVDDVAVSDGDAGDQVYSSSVLTPGYDGIAFLPGGASRLPDGTDTDSAADWTRNDYDGGGLPGFTGTLDPDEAYNTPGYMNETAIDIIDPVITVDLNRTCLWPPNHKMVDILATVVVTDNRDPAPTYSLVSIESNEPDNGVGDGNTVDDIQIDTDTEFALRSERQGGGEGREYTITYEAEDATGNTTRTTVAVRVPHDHSGKALAASGFLSSGEDLDDGYRRFAVVIPSQRLIRVTEDDGTQFVNDGFDATAIDIHHVYLGNSRLAFRPEQSSVVDANGDGTDDIALYFSADAVRELRSALTVTEIRDNAIGFERHDWKSYGDIGLRFEVPDGTEMKVENIFALGPTVSLETRSNDETTRHFESSVYPNPFNPSTTVAFELTAPGRVSVKVFDVSGRLVKTLADNSFADGAHELHWDGFDDRGARVASGIYFIRIESGAQVVTRRAVMLK